MRGGRSERSRERGEGGQCDGERIAVKTARRVRSAIVRGDRCAGREAIG
jgi:hypothetical protein